MVRAVVAREETSGGSQKEPASSEVRPVGAKQPRALFLALRSTSAVLTAVLIGACSGTVGREDGRLNVKPNSGLAGEDHETPGTSGVPGPPGRDGAGNARSVGFVCDPSESAERLRFRRLTTRQYRNTLRDTVAAALSNPTTGWDLDTANALMTTIEPSLARLPQDQRFRAAEDLHGSYRRLDQAVDQAHVQAWYQIALAAANWLTESRDRLEILAGTCAVDGDPGNDGSCLADFVARFGAIALRRPLTAAERARYEGFYAPDGSPAGEDPLGFADVVAGLLNAPQFLYVVEHGQAQSAQSAQSKQSKQSPQSPQSTEAQTTWPTEAVPLSAHELAARLSFHFWNSMPDEQLLALAESGEILEAVTYAAEVERLFRDARTRDTVREFFRDWLKLEDLPELDMNNSFPVFQRFAGEQLPSPDLREAMIDEVLDLLDYHTWEQQADLFDLLTTDLAFARTEELAALYGLPVWNGQGKPPAFPPGARPGILTRAAFLATGSANTRPVMKGVFIRRNILCDDIPPPPDNAAANTPLVSEDLSTREVVEELTEADGSVCASCHATAINPLGFATEGFDALGRAREEQVLLSQDGEIVGMAEINTRSVPRVFPDDATPSEGPADLMRLIADSGKAEACLARHYFRFTFGRFEDKTRDGCVLEALRQGLSEGGNLPRMLKEVALSPAFRSRSFASVDGAEQ
ncbi:MAG: DUF1592 domain-containing protein [Myxococcales bacterium]|nr:DUF1592 domain-containing protein [Myxococcales bacterium]